MNRRQLNSAAFGFDLELYRHFSRGDEMFTYKRHYNFGTVTLVGERDTAVLSVLFPDKKVTRFGLARFDQRTKRPIWVYNENPRITRRTFELFQTLSMWWSAAKSLEEQIKKAKTIG